MVLVHTLVHAFAGARPEENEQIRRLAQLAQPAIRNWGLMHPHEIPDVPFNKKAPAFD